MRVNGLKLRTGRVMGAITGILALVFASGFITAKLSHDLPPSSPALPTNKAPAQSPSRVHPQATGQDSAWEESIAGRALSLQQQLWALNKVIREDFEPYSAYLKRGDLFLKLTLYERARLDFEEAIEYKDDSHEGYLGRGQASLGLGDFEAAESDLIEAVDLDPSKPQSYLALARLYRQSGQFEKAHKQYEFAILRSTAKAPLRREWARLCEESGDFERARELYSANQKSSDLIERELAELGLYRIEHVLGGQGGALPSQETQVPSAALLLARARCALQSEDNWDVAQRSLDRAFQLTRAEHELRAYFQELRLKEIGLLSQAEEFHHNAFTLLCLLRIQRDQKAGVRKLLFQESERFRGSWEYPLIQCRVFKERLGAQSSKQRLLNSPDVSAQVFRSARLPKEDLARFEHPSLESFETRRRALSRLLYLNPWHDEARFERAKILARMPNKTGEAIQDLERVLAMDSSHWKARLQLAQCLEKRGAGKDEYHAREHYKEVIKQLENSGDLQVDTEASYSLADAYYRCSMIPLQTVPGESKNEIGTLDGFSRAVKLVPRNTARGLWRAETYIRAKTKAEHSFLGAAFDGDCEEAWRCRELRSKRATEHSAKAKQATEERRYKDAIKEWDLSIAYDPSNAKNIHDRGLCSLKIGHYILGIFDLCKAVELDYQLQPKLFSKLYQSAYVVDYKRIIAEANRSVRKYPRDAHIRFMRGVFYLSATEFKEFDKSVFSKAEDDFTVALQLNPNFTAAYEMRAYLRIKMARLQEAHNDLDEVEGLASSAPNALFYRALALAKQYHSCVDGQGRASMKESAISNLKRFLRDEKRQVDRLYRWEDLEKLFPTKEDYRQFVKKHSQ